MCGRVHPQPCAQGLRARLPTEAAPPTRRLPRCPSSTTSWPGRAEFDHQRASARRAVTATGAQQGWAPTRLPTTRVNLYTCPNSDQSNRRDNHRRQHTLSARRRPPRPSQPPDANTKRRPSAPPLSGPAICITRSMPPPSVPTVCTTAACPLHRSQQHHRVSVHCTTGTSNVGATKDHHRVQPFCKSSFTLFVPLHRSRCSSLPSAGCQHADLGLGGAENRAN